MKYKLIPAFLMMLLNISCSKEQSSDKNHLSFKIDGTYWESDADEIFGSYHLSEAIGPKIINIAGAKGSGATQQAFNINLFNTDKEGAYTVNIPNGSTAGTNQNVAQLANLTASNYLCGGTLQGNQLTISITKVSKSPQIVEATFSGTMQCVEGNIISVTEGKFRYQE
ncbi:MAG TPA: hypothetical protein PK546_01710 [Chitinophagales bacterium]|nr:hypothetical protein [Chitinophagales bacterium]HOY41132.1 hypothetical protein [Chitinophagales bacterium]HPH87859.1 hypothetical protein [Chitinophagales bacterium]HPN18222.1 hypothetical protein [Chitinophagales bacterium]